MVHCVLDAFATFPWLFEDEASPTANALLDLVTQDGAAALSLRFAAALSLRFLECANGLAMTERRNRIDSEGVARAIELLARLPLEPVPPATLRSRVATRQTKTLICA